jgi:hypothetical protein
VNCPTTSIAEECGKALHHEGLTQLTLWKTTGQETIALAGEPYPFKGIDRWRYRQYRGNCDVNMSETVAIRNEEKGGSKMKARSCQAVLVLVFVCLLSGSVSAQPFLFQNPPKDRPQIGLRYLHPYFASPNVDFSDISGVYDIYANIPVGSKINVVVSVPIMTMKYETSWYEFDKNGLGNIHIGMQYRSEAAYHQGSNVALGVFLPTASDEHGKYELSMLSALTNNHELQKYLPDLLTFHCNFAYFGYQPLSSGRTIFGIEAGPYVLIPTGGIGDPELFTHHGLAMGLQLYDFAIIAEVLGLAIVSEDIRNFRDRFDHELAFGLQWVGGVSVFYKVYLDEDNRDVVDGVLGIKIEFGM